MRWLPWAKQGRSSVFRQATLRPVLPTPYLMVQTTPISLTRSSLACVTCHIGQHTSPQHKPCDHPHSNHHALVPPWSPLLQAPLLRELLHKPLRVPRYRLQRSWVAPASLTKRPVKCWLPRRTIAERKILLPTHRQQRLGTPA